MRAVSDTGDIELLDRDECVRLLATQEVGRIGFVNHGAADVLPVNYSYEDSSVIVRTAPGAKLDDAPLSMVSFEVDDADPDGAWGWSVVVRVLAFDITRAVDSYSRRLRLAPVEPC